MVFMHEPKASECISNTTQTRILQTVKYLRYEYHSCSSKMNNSADFSEGNSTKSSRESVVSCITDTFVVACLKQVTKLQIHLFVFYFSLMNT